MLLAAAAWICMSSAKKKRQRRQLQLDQENASAQEGVLEEGIGSPETPRMAPQGAVRSALLEEVSGG